MRAGTHPFSLLTALPLTVLIVGALIAGPAAGDVSSGTRDRVVAVGPPSGTDDTRALRQALRQCIRATDRCVVQLDRGTYKTGQIITYDFRGTLRGRGQNLTTLEALPGLRVSEGAEDAWPCQPNLMRCRGPSLVLFVNGAIRVTDLTFDVPSVPAMLPWELPGAPGVFFTDLVDVLRVVGSTKTDVTVTRVRFKGRLSPNSPFGSNLFNGMVLGGEFARRDATGESLRDDFFPFRGTVRVIGNTFENVGGSHYFPNHDGSEIVIAHNLYDNVGYGVELGNVANSTVAVIGNRGTAYLIGMLLYNPWFPPDVPTQFRIVGNDISVGGPEVFGLLAIDNSEGNRVQDLLIAGNSIHVENTSAIIGINTFAANIIGNRLTGTGDAAIQMIASSECRLAGNGVRRFDAAVAKIILDETTSRCVVSGPYAEGDVLDLGDNNVVWTW